MSSPKSIVIGALILSAGIAIFAAVSLWKTGCSATHWLNPDSVCRVHDQSGGRVLVEYFNADTNELRLYLQQDGRDVLIEHPHGRVSGYSEKLDSNEIKLDRSDPRYLVVNGERFEIVILK